MFGLLPGTAQAGPMLGSARPGWSRRPAHESRRRAWNPLRFSQVLLMFGWREIRLACLHHLRMMHVGFLFTSAKHSPAEEGWVGIDPHASKAPTQGRLRVRMGAIVVFQVLVFGASTAQKEPLPCTWHVLSVSCNPD